MQVLAMAIIKEENHNLTPAQKELLQWHFCLGPVSFGWLQQLAHKLILGLPSHITKCD